MYCANQEPVILPIKYLSKYYSIETVYVVYYEVREVVSSKLVVVNRLFTAVMLVVLLIACQEMPESESFGDIKLENLAN